MAQTDGVPTVVDVASVLSLEFVGSLSHNFGDLVGSFPCRAKLTSLWVFGVLEDSTAKMDRLLVIHSMSQPNPQVSPLNGTLSPTGPSHPTS